ncbi:hypothetical protein THRCLA_22879 [Thraustotheca clavata]|uniref:Uncharacterized protein n=1 Tax=Thraustotheca clavata TaxID=74557 RepID=A0A1V9YRK4_9STRA|nr:hypothetical protein THRCLA_22879 [Thraustotheca clavata]
MVIPPSYAKQVAITNHSNAPIAVEAVFGSEHQAAEGHAFITDHVTIAPNATVVLGEHEYNMGTWTAVAAVHSVHATHPTSNARATWQPQVSGIVSVVHVDLGENANEMTLHQRN